MASWLAASPLLGGDFVGDEMIVNLHQSDGKSSLRSVTYPSLKARGLRSSKIWLHKNGVVRWSGGGRGGSGQVCALPSNKRRKNFATCRATTSLVSSPST